MESSNGVKNELIDHSIETQANSGPRSEIFDSNNGSNLNGDTTKDLVVERNVVQETEGMKENHNASSQNETLNDMRVANATPIAANQNIARRSWLLSTDERLGNKTEETGDIVIPKPDKSDESEVLQYANADRIEERQICPDNKNACGAAQDWQMDNASKNLGITHQNDPEISSANPLGPEDEMSSSSIFDNVELDKNGGEDSPTPKLSMSASSGAIAVWWINQSHSDLKKAVAPSVETEEVTNTTRQSSDEDNVHPLTDANALARSADQPIGNVLMDSTQPSESLEGNIREEDKEVANIINKEANLIIQPKVISDQKTDMECESSRQFSELQAHINELTEEKYTLQRCLEQQTNLADRLADENEALVQRLNDAARSREEAINETEMRQKEVLAARNAVAEAMAERDAYEMSAREAAERIQYLASEVVALEEKLLKATSETLKFKSMCEKLERGSEMSRVPVNESQESDVSGVVNALRIQVESLMKEREALKDEVKILKRELINRKNSSNNSEQRVKEVESPENLKLAAPPNDIRVAYDILVSNEIPQSVALSLISIVENKKRISRSSIANVSSLEKEGLDTFRSRENSLLSTDGEETRPKNKQACELPIEIQALLPLDESVWPLTEAWENIDPSSIEHSLRRIYRAIDVLDNCTISSNAARDSLSGNHENTEVVSGTNLVK